MVCIHIQGGVGDTEDPQDESDAGIASLDEGEVPVQWLCAGL